MNLVEGSHDKTDSGLRAILFAQARVRLYFAATVILGDLLLFLFTAHAVPFWFLALTAGYTVYVVLPFRLIRLFPPRFLLMATAVLDPLMLSIWIAFTSEYGSVLAGFYLFTTLGFGFRTGRPLMHLCQIASIIGFALAIVLNPYWQHHPVVWTALLIPLVAVPIYAGTLIKTLRLSREHAEEQSRAKSDLLAKVSHELRTPLTGIVASAELLAVETTDASVARRTQTILTLSDNLLCEINDLLDEAKFDAKTVALNYAPVDLGQRIETLRATFEMMAARKGLAFLVETDPSITDLVEMDAHHLDRILLNLTSNAIKFTETGNVRLVIELREQTETAYQLRFSVIDTGIGIPETFRAKMFEPFAQVDQGISRRYGGTGLGLALSRKIIDTMGGDLQFESTLGSGSRFWFELTLRRAAPEEPDRQTAPETAAVVCGKRILVADDNVSNLMLLKELLEIDHHEVTTSASGVAALELLSKRDFDLLLLDYNLGDMDGVRVLQTYRFGRLHPVPALFLTADATLQTATRLQEAGGAGILYKPIGLAGIRDALARLGLPATAAAAPPAGVQDSKPGRPMLTVVPNNPLNESVIEGLRKINTRPEFLPRLLSQADTDIMRCCQQLLEALADKNYASIRTAAHALKGVAANVGAIRMVALASTLMNMSSDEIAPACERLAADVRESSRATAAALRRMVADAGGSSTDDAGLLQLD